MKTREATVLPLIVSVVLLGLTADAVRLHVRATSEEVQREHLEQRVDFLRQEVDGLHARLHRAERFTPEISTGPDGNNMVTWLERTEDWHVSKRCVVWTGMQPNKCFDVPEE